MLKVRIAVAPAIFEFDDYAAFYDGLESYGFDTVWVSDVPLGGGVDPLLGLSFAAARTSRLKLGANIVPLGRNPYLLAKELAQLDRLAAGRVLISLVPGVDQPGERAALGAPSARWAYIEALIPLLRAWWAGDAVSATFAGCQFELITLPVVPVQQPLEIWLGGHGPKAIERVGRLADGWLGSALTPGEAALACREIVASAERAQRVIDTQHFGLSVPFAMGDPDAAMLAAYVARRPGADPAQLVGVGRAGLRDLLCRYRDAGVSKFVVRAIDRGPTASDWTTQLAWLADAVLDLQT